ncbi:hypothetical protein MY04_05805 (plasmid) [Flammeovirga sp. MY04]|uniref:hypothetical protein n=1 Tax=Flammeovirga sp. MY04 TaxID=1191459 RepID=UPI0008062DF6|nr:hypothetical protein [Flammeovirga sp. MY04]ANQ52893.1 hypothetical protein MY04_05805 [Flammeovirga sp. MY04]
MENFKKYIVLNLIILSLFSCDPISKDEAINTSDINTFRYKSVVNYYSKIGDSDVVKSENFNGFIKTLPSDNSTSLRIVPNNGSIWEIKLGQPSFTVNDSIGWLIDSQQITIEDVTYEVKGDQYKIYNVLQTKDSIFVKYNSTVLDNKLLINSVSASLKGIKVSR